MLQIAIPGTVQQAFTRRDKGRFIACVQGRGGEVLRTATGLEGKREGLGERELEREEREGK